MKKIIVNEKTYLGEEVFEVKLRDLPVGSVFRFNIEPYNEYRVVTKNGYRSFCRGPYNYWYPGDMMVLVTELPKPLTFEDLLPGDEFKHTIDFNVITLTKLNAQYWFLGNIVEGVVSDRGFAVDDEFKVYGIKYSDQVERV